MGSAGLAGTRITGPPWLLALLPVFVGAPLTLRRRAPVVMLLAISAAIALQCLITRHPPHVLELLVLFAGGYSLGAHASLRRAAVGLGMSAVVILSARSGLSVIPIVAFWLAGVLVRARLQAASLARRNEALQQQAEQAAAAERTRIARELHDIIAHHLSVVVLQVAGETLGHRERPPMQPWRKSSTADGRRWPRPAACSASCATPARRPASPRSRASASWTRSRPASAQPACR